MAELILWMDKEINRMRRDLDHLLNQCCPDIGADLLMGGVSGGIPLETFQTDEALTIKALLPGVSPKDLEISASDDKLIIKGCKKETSIEGSGYYQRVERKLSSFIRTIPLPPRARIGKIRATLNKGILNIVVPKWKPREIRNIEIESE
jgi:HSP20 family protein